MKVYYLQKSNELVYSLGVEAKNGLTKTLSKGLTVRGEGVDFSEKNEIKARLKYEKWIKPIKGLPKGATPEEINEYLVESTRIYLPKKRENRENSEAIKDLNDIEVVNLQIGPPIFQKLLKEKGLVLKYQNVFPEDFFIGLTIDGYF